MISTIRGDRYITLYRGGEYYNIINCLQRGTSWITLVKGDNVMAYRSDTGLDYLEFRIASKTLYEGI